MIKAMFTIADSKDTFLRRHQNHAGYGFCSHIKTEESCAVPISDLKWKVTWVFIPYYIGFRVAT